MISFEQGGASFNYRVAGVALDDVTIVAEFLRKALLSVPSAPQHVVQRG